MRNGRRQSGEFAVSPRNLLSVGYHGRWKLHLRPSHLPLIRNLDLPALPARVSVEDVFVHFLTYVKNQLQEYITSQFGAGASLWATLYPTMHVILTTPNGWEGVQQQRMRAAAIRAGLVHPEGNARVSFVTEAEVRRSHVPSIGLRSKHHLRRLPFCMQVTRDISTIGWW